jgi:hypothetical protein
MTYYSATTTTRPFKIPKINFLDKLVFNNYRRNISTDYFSAIERAKARLDTKLRVLQQEYDDYLAQIRQILNAVTDVSFSRKRFVDHNIRGFHCNFCSSWSQHRWFNHRLQEVSDKRRLAYNQVYFIYYIKYIICFIVCENECDK